MDISYVFAGLIVRNRDEAVVWYQRLLGRPPDMLPNDAEAAWQLTENSSVYLLADAGRAGGGVLTLIVADLDATRMHVAERGILTEDIQVIPGAGRKATFDDPDGNTIALVELFQASTS